MPHFNRESLEQALPSTGIRYVWMKGLGGAARRSATTRLTWLCEAPFRNYADHMLTPEFETAISELVHLAGPSHTVYMCAERVWFHCHRMLVSDWLVAHGHTVLHIDGESFATHRMTAGGEGGDRSR